MEKTIVTTTSAPGAIGPYSQAVRAGGTLYVSGQLPIDPATGVMPDGIEAQTLQSMKNVMAIVCAAGSDAASILKCTLYIRDMAAFSAINAVYAGFFDHDPPARAVIAVSRLPKDASIEIEAIALCP
ncbi:MAG: Rid family detoxifying hydrolase [Oscillospiraceae bacterium]|nr:Rid family detoxifying hydrolase [Oscillospiraceae bacterium]